MSEDRKWYEFWKAKSDPATPVVQPLDISTPKGWEIDVAGESRYGSQLEITSSQHPGAGGLSYDTLHAMARTPVMGCIIST